MAKKENTKEIEKDTGRKAIEEQTQKIPFIGRDLTETYKYYLSYNSKNQLENYNCLIKLISIGITLIPITIDKKEKKIFSYLKKRAQNVLMEECLDEMTIKYSYADHGDQRYPVYEITADDMNMHWHSLEEKLDSVKEAFKNEQCNAHIPELQKVHNMILHILTIKKVIKKEKPEPEEIMTDFINNILKKKLEGTRNGI